MSQTKHESPKWIVMSSGSTDYYRILPHHRMNTLFDTTSGSFWVTHKKKYLRYITYIRIKHTFLSICTSSKKYFTNLNMIKKQVDEYWIFFLLKIRTKYDNIQSVKYCKSDLMYSKLIHGLVHILLIRRQIILYWHYFRHKFCQTGDRCMSNGWQVTPRVRVPNLKVLKQFVKIFVIGFFS